MKNILLILFLLMVVACKNNSKQDSRGYILMGTLKGIDSGLVKLVRYKKTDGTWKTVDNHWRKCVIGSFQQSFIR